ncbi:iron complex transport system substrate-binding protein [Mobilisporobacter senegalensis]|uniref:Iron complex transport system substrate-binding protein n=2 Tax=Mobilisporobacter senegalensis TaxID=1329262 RepID=A0A3N1XJS1_9FIRM|nr:iron complex transport system substrate-binding protein [Mobilisporobacter senegalensis]
MKKNLFAISIILMLTLTLSACGSTAPSAQKTPDSSVTETSQNSSKEEGEYPMTFNNYGREVVINTKPQKVLTLGPNCTELFVALGLTDHIVGNSLKNHSRGPLPEYAKEFEKIPELNYGSATREAVISSGADFIYGLDWEFGGDSLNTDELETYGISTYMNSATSMEEIYQEILDIGQIFGVTDKAQAYVEDQKARISAVQEKIEGKEAPKVLIYDSGNDGVFTCSGVNFESLLIGMAGGENLFGDLTEKAWITVSYEEVLAREPDVIVIHDYDSPSVEEKIAEIKGNDMFAQLDCVKNERFVTIELESVLPGNRMAYTVEKLAKGFYPDLFN